MSSHDAAGSSSTPPPFGSPSSFPNAFASSSNIGQTRSRTLLFLSYRDSSGPSSHRRRKNGHDVYFQAPYTDGDDPLGSSSLARASIENRSLLRSSHEGHVALDVQSDLPPKWMDVSDQVDQTLASIKPRMARLSQLHEKHLRPGFADKSSEEQQIESLALEITKDFRRCSKTVANLASFTQELIRDAKRQKARGGSDQDNITVRQIALAQNVQTALATRVQNLSGAFRKQQSLYLKRMKGMEIRDRDIRAAQGLSSAMSTSASAQSKSKESQAAFRDSEVAVREDMELSSQQLASSSNTNLLLFEEQQSLTQSDLDIQQRSREINGIAKSIQELAQLFGDLQNLVIDQGTMLDRIDYNVELMSTEIQGAVRELDTATKYQRRSGRRQCILFLILLITLLIAIIIIKPFWRFFFPPTPQQPQQQ